MPKWLNFGFYLAVILFVHDGLMVFGSIKLIHYLRLDWAVQLDVIPIIIITATTLLSLYVMNVYQFHRRRSATSMAIRTFIAILISGLIISSALYATKSTDVTTIFWRGNLPFAMLLFAVWASLVRYIATIIYNRNVSKPNWLVVGSEQETSLAKEDYGTCVSPGELDSMEMDTFINEWKMLMSLDNEARPTGIILANQNEMSDKMVKNLMHARLSGTSIIGLSDFYEQYMLKVPVLKLQDSWFIFSNGFSLLHHDIALKIKRLLDIMLSAAGIITAIPLMLLVALVVAISSKGPAIYSQERYGQYRKVFRLKKFRTMMVDAEKDGAQWSKPNDPRITFVGKFLRKSRIDELPQLWNVFKGEMSFIGPRPERPDFVMKLEKEIPYYDLRHLVKPGISGWAQVMYPYGNSAEDSLRKLEYDLYYIKNYSLTLDMYIILRTVRTVFSHSGM